jgi:hypothetical protein
MQEEISITFLSCMHIYSFFSDTHALSRCIRSVGTYSRRSGTFQEWYVRVVVCMYVYVVYVLVLVDVVVLLLAYHHSHVCSTVVISCHSLMICQFSLNRHRTELLVNLIII